jgi:maltose O-acetyltransferase
MNLIKEFLYRLRGEYTTEKLISMGMTVGKNFGRLNGVILDPSHCWLITIGNNVTMAPRVHILCHDASTKQFLNYTKIGRVTIGDNVFIGTQTTILKGVIIGSNVVIGSNSLINKDVPDNCVVVGNPQRVVCDIDTYLEKRRAAQIQEAADLYDCWRRNSPEGKRGEVPSKEMFREFFWLFESREADGFAVEEFENVMALCGTYDKSVERFNQTSRAFLNHESFLEKMESMRI